MATYNIRKSFGLDWKRNPARIVSVIEALDADIIAIQEIDKRFGRRANTLRHRLIEAHTDYELVPVAQRPQSAGWHGNGLLVKRALTARNIQVRNLPSLEPRGAVAVDIFISGANKYIFAFRFICTHLGLLARWRRQQIADIADQLLTNGLNIIAGDFNSMRGDYAMIDHIFDAPYTLIEPGYSFHSTWPCFCLDKFLITGSDNYRIVDTGVFHSGEARKASDHLPVWLDIEL